MTRAAEKCFVCGKPVNFNLNMGGCYVGKKPHCSAAHARKTLGEPMYIIDEWTGCYPSSWKGKITPDAITHPAKFSSKLIQRIYEHMIEEKWIVPGQIIIDPFGGVGLGALDAANNGIMWIGIELEVKFRNLAQENFVLWAERYWCYCEEENRTYLLQLREEIHARRGGGQPKKEDQNGPILQSKLFNDLSFQGKEIIRGTQKEIIRTDSLEQRKAMVGEDENSLIESGEQRITGNGEEWSLEGGTIYQPRRIRGNQSKRKAEKGTRLPDRTENRQEVIPRRGGSSYQRESSGQPIGESPTDDQIRTHALTSSSWSNKEKYCQKCGKIITPLPRILQGDSRRLLEVLRSADGSVRSPPYADSLGSAYKSGIDWSKQQDRNTDHPHGWNGESYSAAGAISSPPYSEARIGQESGQEQAGHHDQYGPTNGQLGAMKAGNFDLALSSPPFRQASGGTPEPKPGGSIDEALYDRHSAGNGSADGYGGTDGQLANMGEGDFDSAVSSPPFEKQQQGHGISAALRGESDYPLIHDLERLGPGRRVQGYQDQGQTNGNLANDSGDDFWLAARQIVDQVYLVLKPGAHAVWVVKGFVKGGKLVDFPGQWRQLCEAAGFITIHEHHAMLVHKHGSSHTLDGGMVEHKTESKSFFRRNGENKSRAAKYWKEVDKKDQDRYLAEAYTLKWTAYEEDKQKRPNIKPPSDGIILKKAHMLAWRAAGSPNLEIPTSIDHETVLCMVK